MGAPSPPPRRALPPPSPPVTQTPVETVDNTLEDRQRKARNIRGGRSSLIVNRGGASGLGGDDADTSIKKKTLG